MSFKVTDNPSDKELVLQIKRSNKNAFKTLFLKYQPSLIRFCYYRTKNLENSKDLVQDLFMKIWINRTSLNPEMSIKAYLYKILINQIINLSRLSYSKSISINDAFLSSGSPKSLSSEKLETLMDLEIIVDSLPEKLKATFLLSRVEGFKYIEIAEICNISLKAVEKRMSSAFKNIRKALQK
jgi:RNA polymerase sigma-70 factor (ECF subfamily)